MGEEEFTASEEFDMDVVRYTVNSLSFIGSLFIIIVYFANKDL